MALPLIEDVLSGGGAWIAFQHPVVAFLFALVFTGLAIWIFYHAAKGARKLYYFISRPTSVQEQMPSKWVL